MYIELTDPVGEPLLVNLDQAHAIKPWRQPRASEGAAIDFENSAIYVQEAVSEIQDLIDVYHEVVDPVYEATAASTTLEVADRPAHDPLVEVLTGNLAGMLVMLTGQLGTIATSTERIARALELLVGTRDPADRRNDKIGRICELGETLEQAFRGQ